MKRLLLFVLGVLGAMPAWALPAVPDRMRFCDIELSIDAEARAKIEEAVAKIKPGSIYFQSLVDRANIYFPFVEEAFALRGVPDDLKYIVIQESSLNPDAVSPSNAVGYWQFKEESARESGITIDAYVDERKHIFQSSLGAAKYFYTIARYYDNYLYAVIGYNRGPVGALGYLDESGFGSSKVAITGQTHWYAIKAIAHKLAYEDAVGKADPPMWLQPLSTHGETDVARLAKAHDMTLEDFKKYNSWIKGTELPAGKDFIYYLPRRDKPQLALQRHVGGMEVRQVRQVGGNTTKPVAPVKVEPKPKPAQPVRDTRRFSYLEFSEDPAYGVDYVRVQPGQSLVEVAVYHGVKVRKLQSYNGFDNARRATPGELVYLKAPKSRQFHIVRAGETLGQIATLYETTVEKLREKNRITGNTIFAGQRLSLKKKVAKGQKPTLLAFPDETSDEEAEAIEEVAVVEEVVQPKEQVDTKAETTAIAGILDIDPAQYRLPQFESKWVTHTVAANESIWKVAKKYGAYAEVIKKLNNLSSSELKAGMQLKVLQIVER